MAISVLFRRRPMVLGCALVLALSFAARADDILTLQSGAQVAGHIESVADGQVVVTAKSANGGTARLPYQLSEIKSVEMAPPPEMAQVAGQPPARVVTVLAPLVKAFAGLPTDWVLDAMGQLADAYTALQQPDQANAIYQEINQLYPNSSYTDIAIAGQAKVLLAQGKTDQALAAVQPVIDAANKTVAPSPADARIYAGAFLVYGQILETKQEYPAALEAYLTVKTMLYQNQALVDQSAQRVQNLRAHQPGVSVD